MSGAEGWVQSVKNNPAGTLVKKDELLASLYSREFRNAEQAYLGSLASLDRLKGNRDQEDPSRSSDASLRINEEQLRSLGMGEPQIKELAKKRSEEHTSELQSQSNIVCRLLLENNTRNALIPQAAGG